MKKSKASITKILLRQVLDSLSLAIEASNKNEVDKEVQYSINISLLLGIVSEGLINEIGEKELDTFTWNELEKSTTPLKWRIISSLKKAFKTSTEPMQTIIRLQKDRNKIAHPKPFNNENDVIVSNLNTIKHNPDDDFILPERDLNVYIGYGNLIKEFNSKQSIKNIEKLIFAIKSLMGLFEDLEIITWINDIENELKELKR